MTGGRYSSMNYAYYRVFKDVQERGTPFVHRGATCIEVRPYAFTITDPVSALYAGVPRRMNFRFWMAETLGYVAGWGTQYGVAYAELLTKLNSNYAKFTNDVGGLFSMVRYGDGIGQGMIRSYKTLKGGNDRRQAYMSVWNRDTGQSYEESPCMTGGQFFTQMVPDVEPPYGVPVKALSFMAHMRSNDLNWGVPYDVATMCALQIMMAKSLGLPIGHYHHTATSMHYYLEGNMGEHPPKVDSFGEGEWLESPPKMPVSYDGASVMMIASMAHFVLTEMYKHFVVDGGKGADFSLGAAELDKPYVKEWADVVRWNWPAKYPKAAA